MAHKEANKSDVLASLSTLNSPLNQMVDLCRPIGQADNQLKPFSVVAEHLPTLTDVFSSIQKRLESITEETDQISESYPVIRRAAVSCRGRIQYLEGLFQAVSESQNKADDYRKAVEEGRTLEMVMMEMLRDARSAAVPSLVANEHVMALNCALEQVNKLCPSLGDQPPDAHVTLNNHGAGSQSYHCGKGNVNNCSGGLQVTGENHNATYNHGK